MGTASDDVTSRRRAVAEAGHRGDAARAREGLHDPAAVVRATALTALARAGALHETDIVAALRDGDPGVRRRACEHAVDAPAIDLAPLLHDEDDLVVEAAAWAMGERSATTPGDPVSALAEVATTHTEPLCREAAVAALGAIGDERGLPAILTATADKPAIRRRAVLALAPFEGPEVDAALQRALTDRDWQVRQAAEDLLT